MPVELSLVDWLSRLAVAAVLSGFIGFERETHQQAAGLRTHMLVGLGAALFTMVGAYGFGQADSARVAAQVVTGIGFLGAGAIFRDGSTVRGLTTAAGLWAVAAIGIVVGVGFVLGAVGAAVVALVVLWGLGLFERWVRVRRSRGTTRPVRVEISELSELGDVVNLACALDPDARQAGIQKTDAETFALTIDVSVDKVSTVAAGVLAFDSVLDAAEIDSAPADH